jgi:hypothetical protein
MSVLSNIRIGRITSSDIVALVSMGTDRKSPGQPFHTYVQECIMERFFKRRLENDSDVLAFQWGKLCERFVHNFLPNHYFFHPDGEGSTLEHPEIKEWVGTPDGSVKRGKRIHVVTDEKCPLTLKSFFGLVSPLYDWDGFTATPKKKYNGNEVMAAIRNGYTDANGRKWAKHKDGEKYYWQLVSNACITGAKNAELIVYCPYAKELEDLLTFNKGLKEPYNKVMWAKEEELPYIYKESGVRNINRIRFEVPQADKDFLTERVKLAVDLINK